MKYYSLVSISIPIGMLLSGCGHYAMTTPSIAFEQSTSSQPPGSKMVVAFFTAKPTATAVLLPNYVKHNESLKYPPKSSAAPPTKASINATPPTKASIEVQLTTPDSTNQQYIQYRIKDTYPGFLKSGHKGRWHHKNAVTCENDDPKLKLFSTPFTILPSVTPLTNNEVQISGKDAKGMLHTWVSKQNRFDGDDDVSWDTLQ
jgi:hypothetical protein